ncbi:hypothetical protein GCM10008941_24410 [Rhizomicrobium palustre]
MQVPGFVVSSVAFAIVFPLLSWLFNRKHFNWRNIALAIAIFTLITWLNSVTGFMKPLTDAVNAALGLK